jgi:hypothetical protein
MFLSRVFGLQPIVSGTGGGSTLALKGLKRLVMAPVKVCALPLDGLSMVELLKKHKTVANGCVKS